MTKTLIVMLQCRWCKKWYPASTMMGPFSPGRKFECIDMSACKANNCVMRVVPEIVMKRRSDDRA